MARVFLSHASGDGALTGEVHRWLDEAGHEVFQHQHPRDGIPIGEDWEQLLYQRLRWADAVVCLITPDFLASMWCTAEVGAARARGIRLLPLCVGPRVIHPLLRTTQHIDLAPDRAAARTTLIEALRRIDTAWPENRSPFPGLRPFDADRHRVFFGRAEEARQLAGLLRSPAERAEGAALLVVGPSGCGKSSLVRAGLVPTMADESGWWTLRPILPGADPVGALARELAAAAQQSGLGWTPAQVRDRFDTDGVGELVDELLLAAPGGPHRRLLVVIDQAEELLTQTTPADRARFFALLRPALTGSVQLVATLRSEFLDPLLSDPALEGITTRTSTLRPLGREGLRTVIEQPTRVASIGVEPALVDQLVEDTDTGEALPLLAFTLAQLGEGIRRGGQLSATHYTNLGGVAGALTRQADAALTAARTATGRNQREILAGLLRLVTVDEHGRPTRWRARRDQLSTPVATELDAFVERRLLITDDTDDGGGVIGVAHEAFLSAWAPLAEAIAANAAALRARRAIEHAATAWHDNARPRERLWGGGQLAAATTDVGAHLDTAPAVADAPQQLRPRLAGWLIRRGVLVTDRVDLNPTAREFLHTSIRRDRFRRRRALTVLSVLLVAALAAAGIAVIQRQAAQEQLRIATARQLIAQANTLVDSDPRTALQLALVAQHIHPSGDSHSGLVNLLLTTPYAGTLTGHHGMVWSVAFSMDGRTLATATYGGTVQLWDLTDRTAPHPLGKPFASMVGSVAFSPDGHTLATGGGIVQLWDLTDRTAPHPLGKPLAHRASVAFSPDSRTLATCGPTVQLWDVTDRTTPHTLGKPLTGAGDPVAFSPDDRTLATGGGLATPARLWDLTDRTAPHPLGNPLTGAGDPVAFSPDGHTLATAGLSGTARLWDLTDRTAPHPLGKPLTGVAGPTTTTTPVAFSPDGHSLATAGNADGTVRLWDLTDRTAPHPLGKPLTGAAGPVVVSSDGHTLATDTHDNGLGGTVRLWDLTERTAPHPLGNPLTGVTGSVHSAPVAFSPDGQTLATISIDDQTLLLWDLTDRTAAHPLGKPLTGMIGLVHSVAFSPDGHTLATTSPDGTVRLWDLTDRTTPHPLGKRLTDPVNLGTAVAFSPDGHTLATTGLVTATGAFDDTTQIRLWDLTDRTAAHPLGEPVTSHTGAVNWLAFSPDGHTLATGSSDDTVRLWDLTDRTAPHPLGNPLTGTAGWVAISPDGHTLATGSPDNTVRLWDLTDRTAPHPLGTPFASMTSSVAFSPDGQTLATTGGTDDTVQLWDLSGFDDVLNHAMERACSITGQGLNPAEWNRYILGLPYQETCPD